MLAIKAVVKNGVIKQLEAIDLPEDKENVIYIAEKKAGEEYSEWTDEEWQRFCLYSFIGTEDDKDVDWEDFFNVFLKSESNIKKKQASQRRCWAMKRRMSGMMYKYFGKYLCQVTGDINKHYGRGVKNVIYDIY